MSLRWRIALGFALVALATAAVIALATPPIVNQGFADVDQDSEVALPAISGAIQATVASDEESGDSGATATQAPATSGALRMAETTQTRFAPAASTSPRFSRWMPPMANHGMVTLVAAQRTYSSVTGFAIGLVPVA